MSELADSIRTGHALGWSFTPLNGKRPTLKGWPDLPRETLDEALAWASEGNVGLRTGQASGVVVVDLDLAKGADAALLDGLPDTATVATGGGGLHVYFKVPAGVVVPNSAGRKLGPHIDVRGDGGQVVYPGSIHPDTGAVYRWEDGHSPADMPLADLPPDLLARMLGRGPDAAPGTSACGRDADYPPATRGASYSRAALEDEARRVAMATDGNRNDTLNVAALKLGELMGGGLLDRAEVERVLMDAAGRAGLPDAEAKSTIRSGLSAGERQPRGAPERAAGAHRRGRPTRPDAPGSATGGTESENWHPPVPVLECLADINAKPLRWLWRGRIPLGKVTLIFGDPGLGKSMAALDIAARVTLGCPWTDRPGESQEPGGVILLSAKDDPADTIRPRMDVAGVDPRRVFVLKGVKRGDGPGTGYFNLASDLPALEEAIRQTADARLVIIDPISAYLGGTDSHKNADIRGLLAPLADLAARYGVAIIGVTHLNKGMGGRALYRATGSLAFIAAARAGWLVIEDPDDASRRLFLPAKMNLAEQPAGLAFRLVSVPVDGIGEIGRVEWEPGPVTMTADDALAAAAADPEARSARDGAADWLRSALADGPMKAEDLKAAAKEAGIAWSTVKRAQTAVGVKPKRQGFGPGGAWMWALPTGPRGEKRPRAIEDQGTPPDA